MQINGAAVRAIREKAQIPQSRLALQADISVQYLNDLEASPQRRKGLNPQIAEALARALDVPLEAITKPRTPPDVPVAPSGEQAQEAPAVGV